MIMSASRAALACALLATTSLTGAAYAQTAPQPSVYQHVDENGVDLTDGSFNFALVEGSIGSGEGAISLLRLRGAGGISDNLTVSFRRTVSGSVATIALVFGNRRETFTGDAGATTFASAQGSGATLIKIGASEYRYIAADGTVTDYGPPPNLLDAANNGFCSPGLEANCGLVATRTRRPNGATTTYQWDTGQNCRTTWDRFGEPVFTCSQFWRQRGLSNNSGYRLRFRFAQEANPTSGQPDEAWYRRTGADLFNDAVAGAPARSVSYAAPAQGVTEITTDGGQRWRLTSTDSSFAISRPGSTGDDIVAQMDPGGAVTSVTRDGVTTGYARIVSGGTATTTVTDALGNRTVVVSDLAVGRPTSITDPLGRTTSIAYDSSGRPRTVTAPELNRVELSYDARGNVVRSEAFAKDGAGEPIVSRAEYPADCTNRVTCNLPTRAIDANGNATDYSYDETHGGVLTVTAPAPAAPPGAPRPQTRTAYSTVDGIVLPTSVSTCQTGASCAGTADEVVTEIGYGANHLPIRLTVRDGTGTLAATRTTTYDSAGDPIRIDGPLTDTDDSVHFRYDQARRRTGTISPDPDALAGGDGPLPRRMEAVTYREDGQVSAVESGTVAGLAEADWSARTVAQRIDTRFDGQNRPVATTLSAGGNPLAVTQTGYDALGRPECVAQRMNPARFGSLPASACEQGEAGAFGPDRIARTVRDAAGQVVRVETAVGTADQAATATDYTDNGRVRWVEDGLGNRTSYVYDGFDRLARTHYPDPQVRNRSSDTDHEALAYDAAGNVLERRLRDGQAIRYRYDALGRLTFKDLPNAITYEVDVSYGYDLLGRLVSTSDSLGHQQGFHYDALGRLLRTDSNWYGSTESAWDVAGRRTRLAWRDGFFVTYDYLATGEMRRIRERGGTAGEVTLATFDHDALGRRSRLTRGNGTVTDYRYDPASRLSELVNDAAGADRDLTLSFGYNPASQIVSNTRSNELYSYLGLETGSRATPVDGLNRTTSIAGTPIGHDGRGNVASIGADAFGYTAENRLVRARGFHQYYDALGRLAHVQASGTDFLYDGANVIEEAGSPGGGTRRRFVHGPGIDEPLVWYEGPGTGDRRWLHADERGSIVAVSNAAGAVTAINRYDDYGAPQEGNASRFQYTGRLWLPEIGLYDYRARMYHPGLVRFMQPDPIGYAAGMNMYAYVGGDPVNARDPSGLQPTTADQKNEPVDSFDAHDVIEVTGRRGRTHVGNNRHLRPTLLPMHFAQTPERQLPVQLASDEAPQRQRTAPNCNRTDPELTRGSCRNPWQRARRGETPHPPRLTDEENRRRTCDLINRSRASYGTNTAVTFGGLLRGAAGKAFTALGLGLWYHETILTFEGWRNNC